LGIIVLGIAVVVGLDQFTTSAAESNRHQLISDLHFLSIATQAYYKKHSEIGGGNNSFTGWELPEFFENY